MNLKADSKDHYGDILDKAGKKHILQGDDIAEINPTTLSIMPAGLD